MIFHRTLLPAYILLQCLLLLVQVLRLPGQTQPPTAAAKSRPATSPERARSNGPDMSIGRPPEAPIKADTEARLREETRLEQVTQLRNFRSKVAWDPQEAWYDRINSTVRQLQGYLTVGQKHGLRKVLLEMEHEISDLNEITRLGVDGAQARAARTKIQDSANLEIKDMLSPEAYAIYQRYQENRLAAGKIEIGVSPKMEIAGVPLTPLQELQLGEIARERAIREDDGLNNVTKNDVNENYLTTADQAELLRAADVLTPDQLALYRQHLAIETKAKLASGVLEKRTQ